MAKKFHMTWYASARRRRKSVNGKWYSISCKQLGVPGTKEASWKVANDWWEREQGLLNIPTKDDSRLRAMQVSRLVQDFGKLDDHARRDVVEAILGVGEYDRLKAQRDAVLKLLVEPVPERTIRQQIEVWRSLLRAACQSHQLSEGRFDAYSRNIRSFAEWIGPETAIDAIDESKLEGFYNHLSAKVGGEEYSPSYAHAILMTTKQFISRLAEMKLIVMPGNIRSRRFRFNHSAPTKIEVFTVQEVREILCAASERMQLYILLMLGCGFYQSDISDLRTDEVDWKAGTITRARSKTRERGGPVVKYKLWPETFALLKKFRADGEFALTTDGGKPLVKYWIEGDGNMKRYDHIQAAWSRLGKVMGGKIRLGMKHLRKTSATIIGQHSQFKFFSNHFLADSPKGMADKHDVVPNEIEFFQALDWLRKQFFPKSD